MALLNTPFCLVNYGILRSVIPKKQTAAMGATVSIDSGGAIEYVLNQ